MFTAKGLGFSDDLIASVKKAMETGRKISTETLEEQVSSGNWQVEAQEGPIASIYETSTRSRFKVEVLDEAKGLSSKTKKEINDLVKEAKKERIKDIVNYVMDNIEDPRASSGQLKNPEFENLVKKYLKMDESFSAASKKMEASRQKALSKAKTWMKNTGKSAEEAIKQFDLLPGDLKHLKEAKMDPVGKEDGDIDNDGDKDKADRYLAKRRRAIRLAKSRKSGNIEARMEEIELDEAPISMMKQYDSDKDSRLLNRLSLKRKQGKKLSPSEEKAERNAKSRLSARGPRTEELELDEDKNKAALEKTDADIAQARKYLKAADNHGDVIKHMNTISRLEKQKKYQQMRMQEAKETKAEMEDEDGDGEKDSKKKKGKAEKCDTVDTKPTDNKTMVQTEELELDEAFVIKHKASKKVLNTHDNYESAKDEHNGLGEKKSEYGIFKTRSAGALKNRSGSSGGWKYEELELAEASMSSSQKAKLDRLKKKHEGGSMQKAMRSQYGSEMGDNIFYGKLTKMAMGEEVDLNDFIFDEEELELDEQDQPVKRGRGRPRKDAAASGEGSEAGDRHIVSQMRKAVSLNGNHVIFDNGEKKHVSRDTAQGFLNKYHALDKPIHKDILAKSAIKSHNHFKNALKGKVEAPKKSKISMPALKSDVMD